MKSGLFLSLIATGILSGQVPPAQKPAAHKSTKPAPAAKAGVAAWTPEVQQYLGVQQGSFTMVGLNRLSKAQLDALVAAARDNVTGDPRKHLLACGPASPPQSGKVRVLITVSGDDPTGQRMTEIRQAVGALDGVEIADSPAGADRALHVVIQEQTLGKRIIGYTASYVTATPCTDQSRKTDAELKGQLGTYTDPKGVDLATDLSKMLKQDLQEAQAPPH